MGSEIAAAADRPDDSEGVADDVAFWDEAERAAVVLAVAGVAQKEVGVRWNLREFLALGESEFSVAALKRKRVRQF